MKKLLIWAMYAYPEFGWELNHGWKYRNAEPSDFYIESTKFFGVLTMIVSTILIIIGLF
ncbi:hypothetical protein EDC18_10120 [Natranaerovirga pectinivora]|uniref:DUF6199 domain-containing protein n=1 Tax=Natranaerovirga pectinivora TaxID=682400 RepID=A0A4R3MN99_9FIRM|nr:DUF6199 family natural product biosynthesis protein [Natranaerovirga pectinivora]TCT16725.1 hypothetical protein EDC18_10120 [Natranaerovirga pectinivora]